MEGNYYRISHTYEEINFNRLCDIAKSQVWLLTFNMDTEDVDIIDHSFMQKEGDLDTIYFVVKLSLFIEHETVYCYTVFDDIERDDNIQPVFFSDCNSNDAISLSDLSSIGVRAFNVPIEPKFRFFW